MGTCDAGIRALANAKDERREGFVQLLGKRACERVGCVGGALCYDVLG